MLKDQNGNVVSPIQALDFIFACTKDLVATGIRHEQIMQAYLLIKQELESKPKQAED